MDPILRALQESGIHLTTEGKHATKGWVQMECPFCTGKHGHHLGYSLSDRFFHCWRCGWKPTVKVLKAIGYDGRTAWEIFHRGMHRSGIPAADAAFRRHALQQQEDDLLSRTKQKQANILPPGTGPLSTTAKRYLMHRRFRPSALEKTWGIMSAGPGAGRYKHRIIIPVLFEGHILSFQARDYTGRSPIKYLTPAGSPVKKLVYGWDYISDGSAIVVEGATDVWRLGKGAVAVFGTGWSPEQRNLLSLLNSALIVFDPEPAALEKAKRLAHELEMAGVKVGLIEDHDKDPGDFSDYEAAELRRIFIEWKLT